MMMALFNLLAIVVILGLFYWFLSMFLPQPFLKIALVIECVIVVLGVLSLFGIGPVTIPNIIHLR